MKIIRRKNIRSISVFLPVALLVAILGLSPTKIAFALSFTPTEAEWSTWPDYCRARYVVSGAGRDSNFARRVSSYEIKQLSDQLSTEVWHWLHHYCAGIVYLERSKVSDNSAEQRKRLINESLIQMMGQFQRTPRNNPFFGIVSTSIARAHWEGGDVTEAMSFIQESIRAQPDFPMAYTLASLIYKKNSQLEKSRDILVQGDDATNGRSAEIHYFLGLVYIDLQELDLAVDHARQAYELGYPLPGLMTKLNRAGRSLD